MSTFGPYYIYHSDVRTAFLWAFFFIHRQTEHSSFTHGTVDHIKHGSQHVGTKQSSDAPIVAAIHSAVSMSGSSKFTVFLVCGQPSDLSPTLPGAHASLGSASLIPCRRRVSAFEVCRARVASVVAAIFANVQGRDKERKGEAKKKKENKKRPKKGASSNLVLIDFLFLSLGYVSTRALSLSNPQTGNLNHKIPAVTALIFDQAAAALMFEFFLSHPCTIIAQTRQPLVSG